jgi:SPP1 family predicted phage head-tail adaptor
MRAGLLRTRITVMQPVSNKDANGAVIHDWAEFGRLWADVRNKSGLETIKADKVTGIVRASIRVRYNTKLNNAMRVIVNNVIYNIKAVMHDVNSREYTDLICEAVT